MEIEKNIAFFIREQFPNIYKEDGPELVALVEDYYRFLESQENQSLYVARRLFEYKDVDTTLAELLLFFKKKFLDDLPLKENTIKFIVKNILDLYRRKGTPAGIELFFAIFFQEFDVDITYPADKMLKVSNSRWRRGIYLQMIPNQNRFISKLEKEYTYKDLISKNIEGSTSKAKAAVSKVNFILLNGIKTPIIYIDEVQGNFERFDEVLAFINGETVSFGRVAGSLSAFNVDENSDDATVGNAVGDLLNVQSEFGSGGSAVVTEVSNLRSGKINYEIDAGGFGYTIDNTRLLVSTITLLIDNPDLEFEIHERVTDENGNIGTIVGQSTTQVGVKSTAFFGDVNDNPSTTLSTLDRSTNISKPIVEISPFNTTSPGPLYPDGGDVDNDVIVGNLLNATDVDVITDVITPHLATVLNAPDYEATAAFSGTASPVNLNTPLDEAFDIETLTIGRIGSFNNVRPGSGYETKVFARAEDSVFRNFERRNQIISFNDAGDASIFSIGEIILQNNSNIQGIVTRVDNEIGFISVTPFDYYGFNDTDSINRNGALIPIAGVSVDYDTRVMGDNAVIGTDTEFGVGRIKEVAINNSGFGYVDGAQATLVNSSDETRAGGTINCDTQGITKGYWSTFSSHLNGYQSVDGTLEYKEFGQRVQDSDFYQEYSYQIRSPLAKSQYEELLKQQVHLAGTKMFGDFVSTSYLRGATKIRARRLFNDDGTGSPLDGADIATLEASVTNFTVDSTFVTADHIPGGTGNQILTASTNLDITKNWGQGLHIYEVTIGMPSVGSGPYPVCILLHGSGGNGAAMVTDWTSDLPGHILIGVQGYQNSWNISNEASNGPDIEMLDELINSLKVYNNIDDTKIRILGVSNGGALALRAAVEISDSSIDTIACLISQTNNDQYRNNSFYYPSDESLTGDAYPNDGYDTAQTAMPQRRILQLNGRNDVTVPYVGGNFVGMTFLTARDSAYRFALSQGFSQAQVPELGEPSYGTFSRLVDYGNVIFMNDNVAHAVSADMRILINNYFENDYDITYP